MGQGCPQCCVWIGSRRRRPLPSWQSRAVSGPGPRQPQPPATARVGRTSPAAAIGSGSSRSCAYRVWRGGLDHRKNHPMGTPAAWSATQGLENGCVGLSPPSNQPGLPGNLDHPAREAVRCHWGAVHRPKPVSRANPNRCTPVPQPYNRIGTPRPRLSDAGRPDEWNNAQSVPAGRWGRHSPGDAVAGSGGGGTCRIYQALFHIYIYFEVTIMWLKV
jgi:hypothetical protein